MVAQWSSLEKPGQAAASSRRQSRGACSTRSVTSEVAGVLPDSGATHLVVDVGDVHAVENIVLEVLRQHASQDVEGDVRAEKQTQTHVHTRTHTQAGTQWSM